MKEVNPKTNLLEHSEAKVQLYGRYLSIFLNILHRAQFVQRIFIFDLFCGEGLYENDEAKGSPIIALDCIQTHYVENNNRCPNITVWFNDIGKSDIQKGLYKIDRVKSISVKMPIPDNVDIKFEKEDFRDIYPRAIGLLKSTKDARGLFFIDPFGYKVVKPVDIQKILASKKAEVLLWLPIAQMYRFAGSVTNLDFPGSEPLRDFLNELFGKQIPIFNSPYDFVQKIRERFQEYLKDQKVYINTFTLERDSTNIYCLFFFSCHVRGYEAMLAAKWDMDKEHGKGFKLEQAPSLFSEIELSGYPKKLQTFIENSDYRTNSELYLFGLENDFLPKHTKSVLDKYNSEFVR